MASGSGWNVWVWLAGGGCGWNLWVWLVGVVVRRYIDSLILLIPTPLVSVLFCSSIPTFCSFFNVFRSRACFIKKLQELLEDEYEDFESLDKVEKSSYVLGSELWESKFDELLSLVKEYVIDVWEIRKHKLYDSDSGPGQQLHSRSSPGERNGKFSQNGKFGQNGKLGHSCTNVTKGKLYGSQDSDHAIVHLGLNVSSSAHNCGCVVDGGNAMAAI